MVVSVQKEKEHILSFLRGKACFGRSISACAPPVLAHSLASETYQFFVLPPWLPDLHLPLWGPTQVLLPVWGPLLHPQPSLGTSFMRSCRLTPLEQLPHALECVWFVPFSPLICQFVHEIFISAGPVPRTVPEKKKDSINISWIGSNGLKWNELHCTALETQGSGRTACPIQLWGWTGCLPQYHKGWWQACKLTVHTNRSCLNEIIH